MTPGEYECVGPARTALHVLSDFRAHRVEVVAQHRSDVAVMAIAPWTATIVTLSKKHENGNPRATGRPHSRSESMKRTSTLLSLPLVAMLAVATDDAWAADAPGTSQTVVRAGSRSPVKGSAEYFTGNVRVVPLFPASDADS